LSDSHFGSYGRVPLALAQAPKKPRGLRIRPAKTVLLRPARPLISGKARGEMGTPSQLIPSARRPLHAADTWRD